MKWIIKEINLHLLLAARGRICVQNMEDAVSALMDNSVVSSWKNKSWKNCKILEEINVFLIEVKESVSIWNRLFFNFD